MDFNFIRQRLVFIGLFIYTVVLVHSLSQIKTHLPEFTGVDPKLEELVKEYKELAKIHGITFKKEVTIGFKKINEGRAIGVTTSARFWREISIDTEFWERSSGAEKTIVLFHELTHAYCDRGHTYGDNKEYKDDFLIYSNVENGFYEEDGCQLSIMYPSLIDKKCIYSHYNEYVAEMFNNCKPY